MVAKTESTRQILDKVLANREVQEKINIGHTYKNVGSEVILPNAYTSIEDIDPKIKIGDDCAAIPDKNGGYTLFAAEGIISEFLNTDPWFAGYSAVMVNINDVLSMGGLPLAVTDVIWGENKTSLEEIWSGMKAASHAYDTPIVGGHTCYSSGQKALSVAIIGHANHLLSSFNAKPGQPLLMAIDMSGEYYKDYPFWNASTKSDRQRLQSKCNIMSFIANHKLSDTAKDISNGGLLGTVAMLAYTSNVGFKINFNNIIHPPDGDWFKWLTAFPSYGFILTCEAGIENEIIEIFAQQEVSCQVIGQVTEVSSITIVTDENENYNFL